MDVNELMNIFEDIIPYIVNVNIGNEKDDKFTKDENLISSYNLKGKKYLQEENGKTTYIPAEKLTLPINIEINGTKIKYISLDGSVVLVKPRVIGETGKNGNDYIINIYDEKKDKIGTVSLCLNESGDLVEKMCTYQNETATHNIQHTVRYRLDENNQLIRNEHSQFIDINHEEEETRETNIYKSNEDVYAITYSKGQINFVSKVEYPNQITDYTYLLGSGKENLIITVILVDNWQYFGFLGDYKGQIIVKDKDKFIIYIHSLVDGINIYTKIDLTSTVTLEDTDIRNYWINNKEYPSLFKKGANKPKFATKIVNGEEILVDYEDTFVTPELELEFKDFESLYQKPFSNFEKVSVSKIIQKKKD